MWSLVQIWLNDQVCLSVINPLSFSLVQAVYSVMVERSRAWAWLIYSCSMNSMQVRMNSPPFQRCQVYDKPPIFEEKVYDWPNFSSLLYEWSHFLTSLFENTHIFAQIFGSEIKIVIFICKLCLQTAKKVYKNQRTLYEYVNILFNQVYE